MLCAACAAGENSTPPAPEFATAILPTAVPLPPNPVIESPSPAVIIPNTPTLPPAVEGITTTQLNVRAQPGKDSASVGMLNIFERVQIFGKDADGGWYRIAYADAFGWVSAEYVQVDSSGAIPLIPTDAPTLEPVILPPTEVFPMAPQDGDSPQAPLAVAVFAPNNARGLQLEDALSAPNGDAEDWLQFTPSGEYVEIHIQCAGAELSLGLWKNAEPVEESRIRCGEKKLLAVTPRATYLLRLAPPAPHEFFYIRYAARVKSVQ